MPLATWMKLHLKLKGELRGLLHHYVMDPASIVAAQALGVQDGDMVLDMCAAPGGKTLILAESIPHSGELVSNEPSKPRRDRLMQVIQQYLPRDVRSRVRVSGLRGGEWATKKRDFFDRGFGGCALFR